MIWAFDNHKAPPAITNSKTPAMTATRELRPESDREELKGAGWKFTTRLLILYYVLRE
jgi:hypothetical protein